MTNIRTGGRILIDNLVAQGCDRIFCVPGESYLAALDALHDTPQIDLVVCRQEGGVTYMAEADGKINGTARHRLRDAWTGRDQRIRGRPCRDAGFTPMILFVGDVARGDRDREGFQEVDFQTMFAPLSKWVARIDDAARIPEYVARACSVAISGRPGPVVLALPEDMLRDEVEAVDRPRVERPAQVPCPGEIAAIGEKLRAAKRPLAIVGGAGWTREGGEAFARFAEAWGLPVAVGFRRQDSIANDCAVYAGNLGYGPNPKLVERVKAADLLLVVGARLGEATTDGYTLITPDHPGQELIHIHPDPNELGRVYRTDHAACVDMTVGFALETLEPPSPRPSAGDEAHREWLDWSTAAPRGIALDLGQVVMHMRDALPADSIICNGAGNFSGWWHRYWRYAEQPSQLAPTNGSMGYGMPAGVAAALRLRDRQVVVVAGDGDFLMNGQELATAVRYGADMLILVVDNASYGTIRMHQEREYPERLSGTELVNPDFAALARAYGAWSQTVERTENFAPALAQAKAQPGVKLLHLKTDVENITANTTITALRERSGNR